jgi:hypothetical protein
MGRVFMVVHGCPTTSKTIGLLIRRSLVRAQVEEPDIARSGHPSGAHFFFCFFPRITTRPQPNRILPMNRRGYRLAAGLSAQSNRDPRPEPSDSTCFADNIAPGMLEP